MPEPDTEENVAVMAATGRECFFKILTGKDPPEANTNLTARWDEVAEFLSMSLSGEVETTFSHLTQNAYKVFFGATKDWDDEPELMRWVWEATVRHMVNIRLAEDTTDQNAANLYDWRKWVLDKTGANNGSEEAEQVGDTVQHFYDHNTDPSAALVTAVGNTGRLCLAVFTPGMMNAAVPDGVPHVSEFEAGAHHDLEIGFWDFVPLAKEEVPKARSTATVPK